MTLVLAFLIGFFGGLRSLTAPALVAWAAWAGWIRLDGELSLVGSPISVGLFTVLAIAEIVADKLPTTPSRTAPPGLIARIVLGCLTGACIATAGGHGVIVGAVLGAVGGLVGCFGGYLARTGLVHALGTKDLPVALAEDALAIFGSLWVVLRF